MEDPSTNRTGPFQVAPMAGRRLHAVTPGVPARGEPRLSNARFGGRIREAGHGVPIRERQGFGIYAVSPAGRPRPVVEHVPEMRLAARTENLGPHHAVRAIDVLGDILVGDRLEEARPTR